MVKVAVAEDTAAEPVDMDALDNLIEAESQVIEDEDEEQAFSAAFSGDEVPEEEVAAVEEEAELVEEVVAEVEEVIADNEIPEPDSLQAKYDQLQTRVRNMEGKNGTLNAQLKTLMETSRQEVKGNEEPAPTKTQINAALQDGEKFKALREEFPEWAEALEETTALTEKRLADKLPDMGAFKTEMQGSMSNMFNEARAMARIDIKYPEWENTVRTREFAAALDTASDEIKTLADSEDANDAIKLLDWFEETKSPAAEIESEQSTRSRKRLEAAVTPTKSRAKPRQTGLSEEEEFSSAFNS
jgi:predicted RNA-binding protein with RPS1 domain